MGDVAVPADDHIGIDDDPAEMPDIQAAADLGAVGNGDAELNLEVVQNQPADGEQEKIQDWFGF